MPRNTSHRNMQDDQSFRQTGNPALSDTMPNPPKKRRRVAPRGSASYTRKRSVAACQVCRARRTKCDNKKPACSFCEKIGAKCVTEAVEDYSSFDPASLKILERLGRIETLLESQPNSQNEEYSASNRHHGAEASIHSPFNHLQFGNTFRKLHITFMEVLSWPVFGGQFGSEAKTIAGLRREPPAQSSQSSALLDTFLSDTSSSTRFIENFCRHVHIKNPILELTNLKQLARRACLEGVGWNPESCLVLLVWAIGAISTPFEDTSPTVQQKDLDLSAALFAAASKRMGGVFMQGGILSAQCFFYSGVYLMSVFQPHAAWRNFLQALACCQELDFAIQASQESEPLNDASPIEQRLYWTCWKSEVELRMLLGLFDFHVQDRIYPSRFPSPPANPNSDDRAWFFYLAEISLRRLNTTARNDIGQILKQSDAETTALRLVEAATSYDSQVEAWLASLPAAISLQANRKDDDVLRFILRCHLADFRELIYWPFVGKVINESAVVGRDEEEKTRQGLQACVDRIQIASFGYRHHHHGTWMLLQSCMRSSLVLLSAAHSTQAVRLLPTRWSDSCSMTLQMLDFWSSYDETIAVQKEILENIWNRLF